MNILVLDDYKNIADLVGEWAEETGNKAAVFYETGPALRRFAQGDIDAIIVDYSLTKGGATGNDFLRVAEAYKKVPSVLMTGSVLKSELERLDPAYDIMWDKLGDLTFDNFVNFVNNV